MDDNPSAFLSAGCSRPIGGRSAPPGATGLVAINFIFPEILGFCHHPNWRTHIHISSLIWWSWSCKHGLVSLWVSRCRSKVACDTCGVLVSVLSKLSPGQRDPMCSTMKRRMILHPSNLSNPHLRGIAKLPPWTRYRGPNSFLNRIPCLLDASPNSSIKLVRKNIEKHWKHVNLNTTCVTIYHHLLVIYSCIYIYILHNSRQYNHSGVYLFVESCR